MSHLRLRLLTAVAALIAVATLGASLGAAPAAASVNGVVISEFRTRGPMGGNDEFIELRNAGSTPVNISGWRLEGCTAGTAGSVGTRATVGAGVVLAAGQSYLFANTASPGPYSGAVQPEQTYTSGITDFTSTNFAGMRILDAGGIVVDGVGAPNSHCREGVGFLTPGSNGENAFERRFGTTDTENNLTDFEGPKTSNPQNFGDTAPTVVSTSPANNDTGVALGANVTIAFSEPVNVTDPWYTLVCSVSGTKAAAVSGGPTTFTLDPAADFAPSETCTLTVLASGVRDQDGVDPPDAMIANFVVGYGTTAGDPCLQSFTPIPAIQGSGGTAAITGSVTTRGVVVGDHEGAAPALRGFYLQAQTGDGDTATSDGIFVFNGGNQNVVSVGDVVRVSGNAGENQGQTQISTSISGITPCGTGSVDPTDVVFPVAAADTLERYEGMLVRTPQTLYVTEHFQLGRFGQVVLSSGGRLFQPTALVAPGAAAIDLQAANSLNRLILDDSSQFQNPDPIVFARNGSPLSASNTLRGGDTLTGAVGVMTYTWAGNSASGNAYRLRPLNALGGGIPNFVAANPRPTAAPNVGGSLKVVGMNLLNFFNTYNTFSPFVAGCRGGVGGAIVECRGADDAGEFARQWPKTVAAMVKLDADIIGLGEIENDGYGADSAIQFLVNKLNDATAPGTYAFIDADAATGQVNALGTDAIKVGLLYKPAAVKPIGTTAALNSVAFVNGGDSAPRNRPALAQAFLDLETGAQLIVSPNHLKSKGGSGGDPDKGDGQGFWADVRTNAATLLAAWLQADPTNSGTENVLIVGDLNSYAREDPIAALEDGGFTNLVAAKLGATAYSYVFDGQWGYLDYAMGNDAVLPDVTGVAEWHINADEPSVLDYNDDFKSAGQIASLYAPNEFRVSDHDPVVVGLSPTVTFASLCTLTKEFVRQAGIANALCAKLDAASRGDARGKEEDLHNYVNQVEAQSGKALTAEHAATLVELAGHL